MLRPLWTWQRCRSRGGHSRSLLRIALQERSSRNIDDEQLGAASDRAPAPGRGDLVEQALRLGTERAQCSAVAPSRPRLQDMLVAEFAASTPDRRRLLEDGGRAAPRQTVDLDRTSRSSSREVPPGEPGLHLLARAAPPTKRRETARLRGAVATRFRGRSPSRARNGRRARWYLRVDTPSRTIRLSQPTGGA